MSIAEEQYAVYTVTWQSVAGQRSERGLPSWEAAEAWIEANLLDADGQLRGDIVPNAPLLDRYEDHGWWAGNKIAGITEHRLDGYAD